MYQEHYVMKCFAESDTESIPSPCKTRDSEPSLRVKSLEELKLEQIQKQDAALYQYKDMFEDGTKVFIPKLQELKVIDLLVIF